MSSINPGDIVTVTTSPGFSNAAGAPTDPTTVRFLWRRKGAPGVTWVYPTNTQIVRVSAGVYKAEIPVVKAGVHYFRWEGTGTVVAAEEGEFTAITKFG